MGLVGAFGTGKSTMLHQLSITSSNKENWVVFNAWKFPERNNLWEGFVLDLVKSLKPKLFQTVRKKIDGEHKSDWKLLSNVLFQGANIFLPGANIGQNLSKLFHSSPAKRAFEFQEILQEFLNKEVKNSNLFIVIEDIDRSGDKGIYFLETLKDFLRSANLNKKVTCIVPMSDTSYRENQESYDKCLDFVHYFEPRHIDFSNFIKKVFNQEIFDTSEVWVSQMNYLFKGFIGKNTNTIRRLKNILRNANIKYQALDNAIKTIIDPRIFIAISFIYQSGTPIAQPEDYGRYRFITNSGWIHNFLVLVGNDVDNVRGLEMNAPIFFVQNSQLKTPSPGFDRQNGGHLYYISDVYLNIYSFKQP